MSCRGRMTNVSRSERTTRVTQPDGSIRITKIIEETSNGRTSVREEVTIQRPSGPQCSTSWPRPSGPSGYQQVLGAPGPQCWPAPQPFQQVLYEWNPPDNFQPHVNTNQAASNSYATGLNSSGIVQKLNELQNSFRSKHGVADLELSSQLNSFAQQRAEDMARTGVAAHLSYNQYGENYFYAWQSAGMADARQAIDDWYNEIHKYNYNRPGFSSDTGHFTQMVWKSSKKVGFGCAKSQDGRSMYVVANYSPRGNVSGQYASNVLRRSMY